MEQLYRTLLNRFNVRDKHTHHDIPDKRNYQFHVQHVQHKADLQMDSRPSQVVV